MKFFGRKLEGNFRAMKGVKRMIEAANYRLLEFGGRAQIFCLPKETP